MSRNIVTVLVEDITRELQGSGTQGRKRCRPECSKEEEEEEEQEEEEKEEEEEKA